MTRSAHESALDQARLLATYLHETPTPALDLQFIRSHVEALGQFASAAVTEAGEGRWSGAVVMKTPPGGRPDRCWSADR